MKKRGYFNNDLSVIGIIDGSFTRGKRNSPWRTCSFEKAGLPRAFVSDIRSSDSSLLKNQAAESAD